MCIAKEIVNFASDLNGAFILATMRGLKSTVHHWVDVYSYPNFRFKDGSVLEFTLEYDCEIQSARLFESFEQFAQAAA